MFYAADELYLKAGLPIPEADYYEEYPQIENGVGMLRSFADEFDMGAEDIAELSAALKKKRRVSVATGVASYPMLKTLSERIMSITDKIEISVFEIKNHFFGETITVSGLLTGRDMYAQLSDKELGDAVAVSAADKIIGKEYGIDRELGIVMLTAMQYALILDDSDAADIIDCIMCFLRHIDTYSLQIMRDSLSKRAVKTDPRKEWLNECWEHLTVLVERELNGMR